MANRLYDLGRQKFLEADLDWTGHDIKAVLVDLALYTPNFATDEFLTSIAAGARVATSINLTGKTATAGVADADDVTFSTVSGAQSEVVVLYRDTGVAATSPLIAYIDTATGLPVTPSGGDIIVQWDNGSNKVFKL